jgi:histidinol-phosphate aminotransferase
MNHESKPTPSDSAARLQPVAGVLDISPYQQGKSDIDNKPARIKLSSNECSFGPSPAAIAAYEKTRAVLHRYPDGAQAALREAIAEVHGLDAGMIVCGNGSEELIGLMVRAYINDGDELLLSENHFVMCRIYGLAQGARVVTAPERDFVTDVDAVLERVGPRTRIVALANPNNPTGTYISREEIQRLHAALPPDVMLLLDGAYAEYVTAPDYDAGAELVRAADNVVMTRTFSKVYGLAGLRIGWAYCPLHVIDAVQRIRTPFNTNSAALAAAAAAVRDQDHVTEMREHTARWQQRIREELMTVGLRVVPSWANFYLVVFDDCPGKNAQGAADALQANGIVPRAVGGGGDHDVLRITVGTDDENQAVLDALRRYLTT